MKKQPANSQKYTNPLESDDNEAKSICSGFSSDSMICPNVQSSDNNLHIANKLFNRDRSSSSLSVSDMKVVFELNAETTQNDVPCERSKNRLNLEIQNFVSSVMSKSKKNVSFMEVDKESEAEVSHIKEEFISQLRSTTSVPDDIRERQKLHVKKNNGRKSLDRNVISTKKQKSYQDMKNGIRSLVSKCPPKAKEHDTNELKCFFKGSIFILLSMIFVLLISVFVYENQDRKHSIDFANAVVELKKQIYGQDEAIHALCENLLFDTPSLRVIALIGGTGVGKSYTVEIIKKNFPRAYAVRQYFPPIRTVKEINIPLLHPNLIIFENLREHDLTDVIIFLKARQNIYKNRLVTVLAVFNIEQMDDDSMRSAYLFRSKNAIESSFAYENINAKIIPYDSLSEDALDKCIEDAEIDSKLTLTVKQFNFVKQSLLRNNVGCKGAYSKVQVIGRMNRIFS